MSGIVWLASYPKSGNTWFRVFLCNLLADGDTPVDINQLAIHYGVSRDQFDRLTGLESALLSPAEIDRLWPQVYTALAGEIAAPGVVKTHQAYLHTADGSPLMPTQITKGVIYLIRNPLDVCVSYAFHSGWSIDTTIAILRNPNYTIGDGWPPFPPHRVGSWSQHVTGWVDAPDLRVHVVRYEDLQAAPFQAFSRAVACLGLVYSESRIRKAIRFSAFEELQRQERQAGFREKNRRGDLFFRQGKAGGWRQTLTAAQVRAVVADHGPVMRRFGYLPQAEQGMYRP